MAMMKMWYFFQPPEANQRWKSRGPRAKNGFLDEEAWTFKRKTKTRHRTPLFFLQKISKKFHQSVCMRAVCSSWLCVNVATLVFSWCHHIKGFPGCLCLFLVIGSSPIKVGSDINSPYNPILPKSSKYLLRRCLEPQKAFSGGVWGSKHPLRRYLED